MLVMMMMVMWMLTDTMVTDPHQHRHCDALSVTSPVLIAAATAARVRAGT